MTQRITVWLRGRWRDAAAVMIGLVACSAMLGDALRLPVLKALGTSTVLAPCPKVFCDTAGLEAFASEFVLRFEVDGQRREWPLTPEMYSRLAGPYQRRNVYGAALAFAPRLPEPLRQAVFAHGLAPGGPLRTELQLPADATNVIVVIQTRTRGRDDRWEFPGP
jgi:hypothetical protein